MKFHRILPIAPDIKLADKSADGTMPARAFAHCEAMRLVSGWGYYLFPPCDISIMWCYSNIMARFKVDEEWQLVDDDGIRPYMENDMDDVPMPGVVSKIREHGHFQLTFGYMGKSEDDEVGYIIRPAINIAASPVVQFYEGVVNFASESKEIFINGRFNVSDHEFMLRRDTPMFQVCPVRFDSFKALTKPVIIEGIPPDFSEAIDPGKKGEYAAEERKRLNDKLKS